jgi:non-heme chloroperoxidase
MPRVQVDEGVSLYVQDVGVDGASQTVVLVPGFGLHHGVWDGQVRALTERGVRVLCVDQRGHGLSDKPLHGYEIPRLAQDLLTVLDRLQVRDCVLVGWSFGGQVAFRAAAEDSGAIARLVLVGTNAVRASRSEEFPFGRPPGPALQAMTDGERTRRVQARRETIAYGFATPPAPEVLDWLLHCSLQMPSWAALQCYRSMLETDLIGDIGRVDVPVLQIVGAQDRVQAQGGADWLKQRLRQSEVVELPACGHYPMVEAVDAFDHALVAFAAPEPR